MCCVQALAAEAYANRDFRETVQLLTDLIAREPDSPRWFEMRAQARTSRAACCSPPYTTRVGVWPHSDLEGCPFAC